jgi:hypothetical protein
MPVPSDEHELAFVAVQIEKAVQGSVASDDYASEYDNVSDDRLAYRPSKVRNALTCP